MNTKLPSLEEMHTVLIQLRHDPKTKKHFPRKVWDTIIDLTKVHAFDEVCQQLPISPGLLKRKIRQQSRSDEPKFQEISLSSTPCNTVFIEISARSGMTAKIQGPISCLNYLQQFFGE